MADAAPLNFAINLGGDMDGKLVVINNQFGKVPGEAEKAKKGLELFGAEVGKVSKLNVGAGGFGINFEAFTKGGSLFTFDLAQGISSAVGLVENLAGKFWDLGKSIVASAAKTEDLNLAIKLTVGDGAGEINDLARSFGRTTAFSAGTVKQALLPLLDQGIENPKLLDDLATAAADVATRQNTGEAGFTASLEALAKINLKGEVDAKTLRALSIKESDYYANLGDLIGHSAKEAEKLTKAGKVASETLLSVATHLIGVREGGSLGTAAAAGGKTLTATLNRLENLQGSLFGRLADNPGIKGLQTVLDNFIDVASGPVGDQLITTIGGAFTTIFGDLTGPDGLEKMREMVTHIGDKVGEFVTGFANAWPDIVSGAKEAASVIGDIAGFVGDIAATFRALHKGGEMVGEWVGQQEADRDTGTLGRTGLGNGWQVSIDEEDRDALLEKAGKGGFFHSLFSSDSTLNEEALEQARKDGLSIGQDAAAGLRDGMEQGARETLESHSPSRVLERIGQSVGTDAGDGLANGARRALVDTASSTGGASNGRGGVSVVFEGDIIVGPGASREQAEPIAHEVRAQVIRMLEEAEYGLTGNHG